MLDVRRNKPGKEITFFCPDCENKYGSTFELHCNFTNRSKEARKRRALKIRRFDAVHRDCGGDDWMHPDTKASLKRPENPGGSPE